jgi:short/branched chain acyl-CoA dehydrogenase
MPIANNIYRKAMMRTLLTRWHSNGIAAANHSKSRSFSSSVVHHNDHDNANDHGEEMPRRMPVTKFTEDEEMVRDAARTWANQEMRPYVREMDDNCKTRPELIQSLFHNGFMGMEIPVQYGGSGMNFTSACLVVEELSRVDPSVSILVDIHNTLTNNAVRFWGTEQLKDKWLPRLASGCVSSFALSEAGSGTDAFAMKSTATPSADGSVFTLNGEKLWISNAIEAGVFLVFANANPSLKHKGITAFMVDANTEGIAVGKPEKKLGLRASRTCPVVFDNVKVDATDVLGDVGLGYKYCINILNEGRIGIASQQIGVSPMMSRFTFIICPHPFDLYDILCLNQPQIAKGCFDIAMPYLNDRTQFGIKLADFQVCK